MELFRKKDLKLTLNMFSSKRFPTRDKHNMNITHQIYIYKLTCTREREEGKKEKSTWECWAPTPAAAPLGPLKTIGTEIWPADI